MYIVKRQGANGGFNVRPTLGSIKRLYNNATEGTGLSNKYYQDTNVSHPFKSLGKGNLDRTTGLSEVKIKSSRQKKYISLNR
jgi:hypothetical protein